ncbi:hypothetical protein [Paenibacillus sp. J2TS4]|uniref:hypothetical protein n=1 Tax=Paenibacillus sp. J2TS4 TaxID=2807194 RepID=UPI001B0C8413|nr:hypothetical protein [Paenibacillus sp. J2TS4]GIP35615.1 hypothetical protein J2TS4_48250 [Paenibacillus sp. J2TS4]
MDKLIDELDLLTVQFVERMDQATYEEVEKFVEDREKLVLSIRQKWTLKDNQDVEPYKNKIARVLSYDSAIEAVIHKLKTEAEQHLGKSAQAKRQRAAYEPQVSPDAFMFDKKN